MGEETEVRREEERRGFFTRHFSKLLVTALAAGATGAGSYGLDTVADLNRELAEIRQQQALQNQELSNLRQEQLEHIWRTLYSHEGQIDSNRIEVGALERYIALAMSEGSITAEDTETMFRAMRELVEAQELEFSPEQIEGFRNMQQKYDGPRAKK